MKFLLPTFHLKLQRTLKTIKTSNFLLPKNNNLSAARLDWSLRINEGVNSKDIVW